MAAQNRKQSETGDLARLLTLKLESRVMLTVNIDIQDRLINGQMGVVKIFEIADNAVSTIFIKFDDREAGRKSVGENRFARQIIGFQLRMTHIFAGNSCNSLSKQRTQFPLRLSWARTIHKVQGVTSQAVVSFSLEKQKTFEPGQMYVALSRI